MLSLGTTARHRHAIGRAARRLGSAVRGTATRLVRERRGNVFIIVAFAMIPMVFATGMGIDYSRAARLRTKLNAVADAAALAAVTQSAMQKTDAEAKTIATDMFNVQAKNLASLIYDPADLTIGFTHPDGPTSRTATVSYTAKSTNSFGGILNMRTITISGTATANAIVAPDIDFYLALDTSPSMALPTTTAGFQTMDAAVKCAFACHSNKIEAYAGGSLPDGLILNTAKYNIIKGDLGRSGSGVTEKQKIDANGSYIYVDRPVTTVDSYTVKTWCNSGGKNVCIYNADGTFVDSYWYALNQGVRLRVTDERDAIKDLMTLAQSYADSTERTYRAALYTFDHSTNLKTIVGSPSALATVSAAVSNVNVATVNDQQGNGCPPSGCTGSNRYLFTSFKSVLDKMSAALPATSGQGTDAPGDTPQAFLFMVTDGMSDEDIGSGRTRKAMQDAQVAQCNAIKDRGIRIAILYTEYTVESIKDDEPNQRAIATAAIPNIAPQLTKCASPDLMYTVKTDESISGALQALFSQAVATARLTQ